MDGQIQSAACRPSGLAQTLRVGVLVFGELTMRSIRPVQRSEETGTGSESSRCLSLFLPNTSHLSRTLLGVGMLFCCSAAVLLAADWPVFRGSPVQTGIAQGKLPDKLELLWEFKAKDGIESAAAVANGVVYLGSYDQNLYALDLITGKKKWHYKGGPFKAPPGVHDDSVYIG